MTEEIITMSVYYDTQELGNEGWAWRSADHSPDHGSGSLDGYEDQDFLGFDQAKLLAESAIVEDGYATHVAVYWHGDTREPVVFRYARGRLFEVKS